jgi:3-methyladenine DNA glycosylase AlkD
MRRSRAPTRRPHATHVQILTRLRRLGNSKNVAGMVRFGINPSGTLGISVVDLRKLARDLGTDHALAQRLWTSGIHEARILAGFIDDPRLVTPAQMNRWVAAFDSWDVCDQVCALFEQTRWARAQITEWAGDDREFVKRAAFAMIAGLAVHDKALHNRDFEGFFRLIRGAATDDRNFVRKAVNWALRSIGKRNRVLNRRAIAVAQALSHRDSAPARWIAADAHRELTSKKVVDRLRTG